MQSSDSTTRKAVDNDGEGYYSIHAIFLCSENCYEITDGEASGSGGYGRESGKVHL